MLKQRHHHLIFLLQQLLSIGWQAPHIQSFVIQPHNLEYHQNRPFHFSSSRLLPPLAATVAAPPSKVEDPDGPTPDPEEPNIPIVDPETIDGLKEITRVEDLHVAVPGQPWRRGDTAGCDAPIHAQWRRNAEQAIEYAVSYVGGKVLDVTWFLTVCLVTLDDTVMPPRDFLHNHEVEIDVDIPYLPLYCHPDKPLREPLNGDNYDDQVWFEPEPTIEAVAAAHRRRLMKKDQNDDSDDIDDPASHETLYLDKERQVEKAQWADETKDELDEYYGDDYHGLTENTSGLSIIGEAILDALEPYEEEWEILARHELILSSPNPASDVIETQKQFNAYRDHHVAVETYDPFGSNRTLKGQLVDRNAMDLLLNIKGRLVTVPLNFVKCVRLPPQGHDYQATAEEDDDDGNVLEEGGELVEAIPNGDPRLMP